MADKFKIDFIGIGTERSATTWLADCLREHPAIFLPKQKELYFFNEFDPHYFRMRNMKYGRGIVWYKHFFKEAAEGTVKGEFTPTYLYSALTAKRIKKHFPNIKIIVSLRNPVDRALSQFLHDKHIGVIKKKDIFEEVIKTHKNYIEKGYYYKYLKYFYNLFPKENIFVIDYDRIKTNPQKIIRSLYGFLGVDKNFAPPSLERWVYVAVSARFQLLNYFLLHAEYLMRQKKLLGLLRFLELTGIRRIAYHINNYLNVKPLPKYPEVRYETKMLLRNLYKNDTAQLEKLVGINLSNWKR